MAVSRALRDVKLLRQAAVLRTRAFLRLVRSKTNEKPLQPASPPSLNSGSFPRCGLK